MIPAHIRPATEEDCEGIWRAHTQAIRVLCRESYSPTQIEVWAASKTPESYREPLRSCAMYVAERDDRIAGFAQLNVERGEVEAVYVSPEDVRTKVGSALLDQLETVAMHRGVRTLTLKSTLNAERFYLRQGYERLGPGDHFGLACIRMRKHLSR